MKKHLFYAVLAIFVASSLVTIAGISGLITVQEKYLDKLIWAFLGQLAAAVLSLFRKTDFFSEEGARRLEFVETTVAKTAAATQLSVIEAETDKRPKIDLTAEKYFELFNKKKDRPLERDSWLAEVDGALVEWTGFFGDVSVIQTVSGEHVQIALHATTDLSISKNFFLIAPPKCKNVAYALRVGDRVRILGRLSSMEMAYAPSIHGDVIERIT